MVLRSAGPAASSAGFFTATAMSEPLYAYSRRRLALRHRRAAPLSLDSRDCAETFQVPAKDLRARLLTGFLRAAEPVALPALAARPTGVDFDRIDNTGPQAR